MALTGKCKEDFMDWYLDYELDNESIDTIPYSKFIELPHSMQYGVYVDFFDSVGIEIEISRENDLVAECIVDWEYMIGNNTKNICISKDTYLTRSIARTKAIEKANEIYNQTKDEPIKE